MFDNVTLNDMSDTELQDVLDHTGKGKAPIYKKPIRLLLEKTAGKLGNASIEWAEVNANKDATRANVLVGLKNAAKAMELPADRLVFRANPEDAKITVYYRDLPETSDSDTSETDNA